MQREVEALGIPTAGVTLAPEVTAQVRPPRSYYLRYPFGHPLGEPDKPAQHRQILLDLLEMVEHGATPGEVREAKYPWRRHRFT